MPTSTTKQHLFAQLVKSHSSRTGAAADFNNSDIDNLFIEFGYKHTCQDSAHILQYAALALRKEQTTSQTNLGTSRWWSHLLNRLANRLTMAPDTTLESACLGANNAIASLPAKTNPAWLRSDAVASIAAGVGWGFFSSNWSDQSSTRYAVRLSASLTEASASEIPALDPEFDAYLRLYMLRYQFRPDRILEYLSGHDDVGTNPIKASFRFYACALKGEWDKALASLLELNLSADLPLTSAKTIASALNSSSPPRMTAGQHSDLGSAFDHALSVWRSVGADTLCHTAAAQFAALNDDPQQVNAEIDACIEISEQRDTPITRELQDLATLRGRLLDQASIGRELQEVTRVKADALEALTTARNAASQIPAVVGLFTAVIALVIGTSQISQGLNARDRIVIISSLGLVLIGFVVCLSIVTAIADSSAQSYRNLSLYVAGVVIAIGSLLAGLLMLAG